MKKAKNDAQKPEMPSMNNIKPPSLKTTITSRTINFNIQETLIHVTETDIQLSKIFSMS